jgi:hypothetical protein
MAPRTPYARAARIALLAAVLPMSGCLSFCHPVKPAEYDRVATCAAAPQCARDHVHIFLVHGLDPLDFANLEGVRDYICSLGFTKVHYGQFFHSFYYRYVIRKIHKEDPDARFVLIGFSYGACMVRDLANSAREDGVPLDLIVYLGGCVLRNTERTRPDNAIHVINILALGAILNGTTLDNAENVNYKDCFHFGSPSHPYTLETLARELAVVAERVPVPPAPDDLPPLQESPRPRPLQPMPHADESPARDDWDFLKPGDVPELPQPRKEDEKYKRSNPVYRPDTPTPPASGR